MPTPFPGMDPYLENQARWPGFHNWLIVALADHLSPQVLPRYVISLEERVYVSAWPSPSNAGIPDLAVIAPERRAQPNGPTPTAAGGDESRARGGATVMTAAVPVPRQIKETYLEIREAPEGDVVTVVEILSPWNKRPGEGQKAYEEKRLRTFGTATHLVEIDLLRAGEPPEIYVSNGARGSHGGKLPGDYRILIARGDRRMESDLYVFTVRDPLPSFPVPLRPGETEPVADLQDILHSLYDRAGLGYRIDYRQEPVPPLAPEDAAWADHLLREKRLR